MKIILLGYMASGKSTIGKTLAKKMFLPFVDLDEYIENKEDSSISDIFKDKGEIYFRKIENKYLKELLNSDSKFILSLGGGTPCYSNNMELINNSNAKSIYLQTSVKELSNRLIKAKASRPLVANLADDKITEFVAKHLFERSSYYEQALYKVGLDKKSIEDVVTEIRILLH